MRTDEGRLPPQAPELEEAILGAILLDRDAYDSSTMLKPEYFYMDEHRVIYEAMVQLYAENKPIDMLTVSEKLKANGNIDAAGGAYKLAVLSSKVSSSANVEYHATLVVQKYNLRQIISVSALAMSQAYTDGADPFVIQSMISNELENNHAQIGSDPQLLREIVNENIHELVELQKSDSRVTGLNMGYSALNEVGHGWHAPDVIIMAARPGEGKTASALNFALKLAQQNIPIAFFSLEMSKKQLTYRLISIMTDIYSDRLKTADITEDNWRRIHGSNFSLPFHIDDTPSLSITELKIKARKLKKKFGIQMIFIDYLQLMTASVKGNREQEISTISRNVKALAKELNVPIMALAQLSRDVEKRNGKPKLSDLRESGSIEQDADIVIFLHNENAEDKTISEPLIEFIWAKHRNGANKIKILQFNKRTQKFTDI